MGQELIVSIVGGIISTVVGGIVLSLMPTIRKETPEIKISIPTSTDGCFTALFALALLLVVNTVIIQIGLSSSALQNPIGIAGILFILVWANGLIIVPFAKSLRE